MTAPGLLVTATDTGVGKTVVAAAIAAALKARGIDVRALKPAITGLDDPPDPVWPRDDQILASVTGSTPEVVAPLRYHAAVSPHLAAQLEGRPIAPEALRQLVVRAREGCEALIVEGVGGLLVPFADGYDVRSLALDAGLPLVIAARPGLGTINHTLLTLEAARAVGLAVAGVVLTPWPAQPAELERSNRDTIAALGEVEVSLLAQIAAPTPALLAEAGAGLPFERWLGLES